jgi:hypothetical protein
MESELSPMLSPHKAVDVLRAAGLIVHPAARATWYIGIPPLDPATCRLLGEVTLCWMATIIDHLQPAAVSNDEPAAKPARRRSGTAGRATDAS